ncbi:MAG: LysE family translocator [Actinobacteria bacterium]|nr:LysE family translocator [Actinomycetota bacterium]
MVVSSSSVIGIALVALSLVLTPGPNMIYLVSRSVTQGRTAGLVSLLGVAAGFGFYLVAAVAGLTSVFVLVPAAFVALKVAGSIYLLYLAWQALRPGGTNAFTPRDLPADRPGRLFTMGLVTNLLNPKIAVLYVALLPQFVHPRDGSMAAQSLILGCIQISIALTGNFLIVLFAGSLSRFLRRRPRWLRTQRFMMGGVLGALAVKLATTPAARPVAAVS